MRYPDRNLGMSFRMSSDFARQITKNQQRLYGYIYSLVGNSTSSCSPSCGTASATR